MWSTYVKKSVYFLKNITCVCDVLIRLVLKKESSGCKSETCMKQIKTQNRLIELFMLYKVILNARKQESSAVHITQTSSIVYNTNKTMWTLIYYKNLTEAFIGNFFPCSYMGAILCSVGFQ